MSDIKRAAWLAALLALAGAGTVGTAHAATPPKGAFTYVGNVDDGARSGVVDRRNFLSGASKTFSTSLDGGDDMAVGDVTGDAFDEILVADDGEGRIDVHDTSSGQTTSFHTPIGQDLFAYNDVHDDLAAGNVTGDSKDEIIIGDANFGMIIVYSATGEKLKTLSGLAVDGNDLVVAGDFLPGKGLDEIAIVNSEDEGRIDVFDINRNLLQVRHSGFDGSGDDVAVGDVTGDLAEEVIVANDEEGRLDSVDFATGKVHNAESAYDTDDRVGAGDVTGDGRADIVVANTENNRVDVINFFGDGGNFGSSYDSDDRFAVGSFGSGDLDSDGMPDRVELLGIRDDKGNLLFDLKSRGASPCRKDVVVEVDHMTGVAPDKAALDNAVKTFAAATEVQPVANCPYSGVSTATGMNLIIPETDPAKQEQIPFEEKISESRLEALIDKHFTLKSPFVRYTLWAKNYEDDEGDVPAGQAGHGDHGLDFVISLAGELNTGKHPGIHEATFVHELGHSLGLDHGGATDDLVNCKPNYLSVMNYSFRAGLPLAVGGGYRHDYSHQALGELDESKLNETRGIGGPKELKTAWTNGKGDVVSERADRALDWNGKDGAISTSVPVDINLKDGADSLAPFGDCESPNDNQQGLQKYSGHNDWEQLNTALAGPDRVKKSKGEATVAQMIAAFEGRDQLFFPDTTVQLRPELPGLHGGSLGVAADAEQIYATHSYRTNALPETVQGDGSLVVLDRESLAVRATIRVGFDPRAVAVNPLTKRAYVLNRGNGTGSSLSVISTVTRSVIKVIPLGQIGVDVEVNTKLNRVYVSNPAAEDLQLVNGATNTLMAPVQVGKGLGGMAVDEASGIVYIAMTHRSSAPSFTALGRVRDLGAAQIVQPQVDLGDPGIQASDVAIDPTRNRVFVGGLGGGTIHPNVTVLDMTTMQRIARMDVPGPIRAIDSNPAAGLVFAVGDRGVNVIDAGSLAVTRHIDAGLPFAVATDNGSATQLFVGDVKLGQLRRLSYSSGQAP